MLKYPVVILPGWLLGSRRYTELAKKLSDYGLKTYIVDFPGFEQGVKLTEALNLTDYVKYLQKFLRLNKITKAVFVCHSFGGRVALKLASQQPQLAAGIVISGTPGFPSIGRIRFYLTLGIAKTGKIISYLPPLLYFRRWLRRFFYRLNRSGDYFRADGHLKETFKNIIKEQLFEYMRKIKVPTLLLWGERDVLVPVRIARRMQKILVNSKLEIIPGQGHMYIYRETDDSAKRIYEFIKTL